MKNNIKLLIVEDNEEIIDLIKLYKPDNFYIKEAKDGKEGLKEFSKEIFDIIVLDLMLPIADGYEVLEKIREKSNIPVIILSSKNLDFEIILGLDKGADDYIVKPFNPMELFARVNALLRRLSFSEKDNKIITCDNLELNRDSCEVFKNGKKIDLTGQEFKLLEFFMINKNIVFTKNIIMERVWENDYYDENVVSVYISRIREKIGKNSDGENYIVTIRGLGYKFDD
ncbi:response regulator [Finegoldia sp. BIOML-A2]|uniref:Response regulator transcription factor n=1 Tax=Finegoldia magna TaxID=1260 RepID=A0A233VQ87_FINMA|nr:MULTISPECIES: response regulator transcription factor [Finegoldia]MBS5964684.1 response regulator transcription factor [Finegoldia magna]MDU1580130.1 response regulator transcription factor [Finegoldia magna]MDU1600866.1 response regulator transcription factor [Finegoldia magna]MDU5223897.1 response regulator transcription factor [Finegoldia magna]MDU5236209.1 response regulator transcription factor [Finegoldia magna]